MSEFAPAPSTVSPVAAEAGAPDPEDTSEEAEESACAPAPALASAPAPAPASAPEPADEPEPAPAPACEPEPTAGRSTLPKLSSSAAQATSTQAEPAPAFAAAFAFAVAPASAGEKTPATMSTAQSAALISLRGKICETKVFISHLMLSKPSGRQIIEPPKPITALGVARRSLFATCAASAGKRGLRQTSPNTRLGTRDRRTPPKALARRPGLQSQRASHKARPARQPRNPLNNLPDYSASSKPHSFQIFWASGSLMHQLRKATTASAFSDCAVTAPG